MRDDVTPGEHQAGQGDINYENPSISIPQGLHGIIKLKLIIIE